MEHRRVEGRQVTAAGGELIWLLGQPQLSEYLSFVRHNVEGGALINAATLVDEWRAANDLYYDLEKSEAGAPDRIRCRKLPQALKPLEREARRHPWFGPAFGDLPTSFEMVELDKLVISQNHVERSFTDGLAAMIGTGSDPADLFRFCIPAERAQAPVRVQRISAERWLFTSGSTDFRAHEPLLFRGEEIVQRDAPGPIACMLGIGIGFGSNFMSAIRSGSRLVLQNGYHRAYALRSLGIRHAPCIVEEVTRKDELKITASENVCEDPEFYFASKRPPMFKDFFDPRFAKPLKMLPIETSIEVELKVTRTTPTEVPLTRECR